MVALESVHGGMYRSEARDDLYTLQHNLAALSQADIQTHCGNPERIFEL